ncbi:GNAT family N-acetyltransferase [Aeromonas veronii]|uniref:GNAT family N-acetyltransferase n=1 Tax=Aeromonas veronii TaxID=654 RepID=UPI0022468C79|nr:GNAT family N-acetyltransferase [Aeromonas veronii]MCX0444402.1 GNAT family N-acetyltransferase [Aeromonas veronii]
MAYQIYVKVPTECSAGELHAFEKLIKLGGEVSQNGLLNRIKNAHFIAFASNENGEIVGISALKRPIEGYRNAVFHKSKSKEEDQKYEAELGWVFVMKEFREKGLGSKLVEILLSIKTVKNVYATAREHNEKISSMLKKFEFIQSGVPYPSTEGDYALVLYIKPL